MLESVAEALMVKEPVDIEVPVLEAFDEVVSEVKDPLVEELLELGAVVAEVSVDDCTRAAFLYICILKLPPQYSVALE